MPFFRLTLESMGANSKSVVPQILLISCAAAIVGFRFGFNVASMLLGGALSAGNLADRFGREKVMIVTAPLEEREPLKP